MDMKQIKELMSQMGKTGTQKLKLKKEDFEIELERESTQQPHVQWFESAASFPQMSPGYHTPLAHTPHDIPPSLHPPKDDALSIPDTGSYITSLMVGTFYLSPSPDDPPFVSVGDQVTEQTVVCIIEAMKVMNEMKANQEGKIVEILVESGHPVEFGTKLFKIIPASN